MGNRNNRRSGNNRRPQAPKGENKSLMRGMQGLRQSNAAGPHKDKRDRRGKRDSQWRVVGEW